MLINRITGLDPAGASYGLTEAEVRLDQTGKEYFLIFFSFKSSEKT